MRILRRLSRRLGRGHWLAIAIAALGATAAVEFVKFAPEPAAVPPQPTIATVQVETPAAATPEAPKNDERVPGSAIPDAQPEPTFRLEPPYRALDARSFTSNDRVMTLDRVTGPGRDDICFDGEGRLFACGLAARAALTNALGTGWVLCRLLRPTPEGALADCSSPSGDLTSRLAREGWVRPADGAEEALIAAAQEARANGRGLWNGGWRIR